MNACITHRLCVNSFLCWFAAILAGLLMCNTGCHRLPNFGTTTDRKSYDTVLVSDNQAADSSESQLKNIDDAEDPSELGENLLNSQTKLDAAPLDLDLPNDKTSSSVLERLKQDQLRFYSAESLIPMGVAFGIGATMANTQIDEQLQRHFRSGVVNATSDDWFERLHASKELGNGRYSLPIFGVAWLANEWVDGPPAFEAVGDWGERSMRGFLVGAPAVVAGQYLTGGSRPSEINGSNWDPLHDNNGVSGHAFMSSLPFITAAKMAKNPWAKSAFYAGSAIGPVSRMNDNAHFPSQIGLGWFMAYLAATAVEPKNGNTRGWEFSPVITPGGSGLAAEYRW